MGNPNNTKLEPNAGKAGSDEDEVFEDGVSEGSGAQVNDAKATAEAAKAMVHLFPMAIGSQLSRCSICTRLTPSIDGVIVQKQSVRVYDDEGKPSGRWLKGQVRIRAITPKECAPSRNPDCPAREVRLVVGANVEVLARQMVKAMADSDYQEVAEIAARVDALDEELQAQFTGTVNSLREGKTNEHDSNQS